MIAANARSVCAAAACLLLMGASRVPAQTAGHATPVADAPIPRSELSSASLAMPAYVADAVADPNRPAADRMRDVDRHPGEVTAFAGIKPGDTVVDLLPGGGYFTRIFSKEVGPSGKVLAFIPDGLAKLHPAFADPARALASDPNYRNVQVVIAAPVDLAVHGPVDVVWTAQNYHDLHNPAAPADTASKLDRAIFSALKPGGLYVIEDHVAAAGTGATDAGTLHRISPTFVRDEVQAAGFVYEAQSQVLQNLSDPHTAKVFDPAIRGHTDQFLFKFRKPLHP